MKAEAYLRIKTEQDGLPWPLLAEAPGKLRRRPATAPENHMIKQFVAVLSMTLATAAMAEGPTCNAAATEKKLAGAAKTSFLTKCEKDAKATCEAASMEKKLSGAAKTSFEKKCITDAVGGEKDAKAACEAASKEKKLSGAAKTSFETKCIKDAEAKPAS